jgi:hypothetical protein
MTTSRPSEPHRTIFIGLVLIGVALLVYFALTAIPAGLRPTLSPTTTSFTGTGPSPAPTAPTSPP